MKAASSGWLNKVPEVTLSFWIIKIMSTTVGETFADFLAVDVGWGLAITSAVMAVLLTIALVPVVINQQGVFPAITLSFDLAPARERPPPADHHLDLAVGRLW
jgi:uncharacterized membrane-anchored protein